LVLGIQTAPAFCQVRFPNERFLEGWKLCSSDFVAEGSPVGCERKNFMNNQGHE
jgi:hypothetical protein